MISGNNDFSLLMQSNPRISNTGFSYSTVITPDSKVHGANMGPIWGRQDPGWPHVGPINLAIWDFLSVLENVSVTFTTISLRVLQCDTDILSVIHPNVVGAN